MPQLSKLMERIKIYKIESPRKGACFSLNKKKGNWASKATIPEVTIFCSCGNLAANGCL